jgi:hypothetical protein
MIAPLLREPLDVEVAEVAGVPAPAASPTQRHALIAEVAFLIAQSRGLHLTTNWTTVSTSSAKPIRNPRA